VQGSSSENKRRNPYLDMPSFALYTPVSAFSVPSAMHGGSTDMRRIARHVLD
jgi:hypothetical protein